MKINVCKPRILQVPYEEGCYWRKGTKEGPHVIVDKLKAMREYSVLQNKCIENNIGKIILEPKEYNPYNKEDCLEIIYKEVLTCLKQRMIPVTIGGDHSITYPIIKAFCDFYEKEFYILQFDAHSDTFNDVGGYKYHHGATFKNIVEETNVLGKNIYQFGIRGQVRKDSFKEAQRLGINVITMDQFQERNCNILNFKLPKDAYFYVSFDIDSIDPAYAPGTGTPVPGGLTSREAIKIIKDLCELNIIGFDLVEVAPIYDSSDITSNLAVTLIMELLIGAKFSFIN